MGDKSAMDIIAFDGVLTAQEAKVGFKINLRWYLFQAQISKDTA